MNDPKKNQDTTQNQSDLNQDNAGLDDQGKAGGVASTEDTDISTDLNKQDQGMSTEE